MSSCNSNGIIARTETIWSYQFRIVLLGDSTVGKSALLRRFSDGQFLEVSAIKNGLRIGL